MPLSKPGKVDASFSSYAGLSARLNRYINGPLAKETKKVRNKHVVVHQSTKVNKLKIDVS